jgi:outer membrane protein assembly factor BamB
MATVWFCKIADREVGPLTVQQVRSLAGSGKLKQHDLVRRDTETKWYLASLIKNLVFSEIENDSQDVVVSAIAPASEIAQSVAALNAPPRDIMVAPAAGENRSEIEHSPDSDCAKARSLSLHNEILRILSDLKLTALALGNFVKAFFALLVAYVRLAFAKSRYGASLFQRRIGPLNTLQCIDEIETNLLTATASANLIKRYLLPVFWNLRRKVLCIKLANDQWMPSEHSPEDAYFAKIQNDAKARRREVGGSIRSLVPASKASAIRCVATSSLFILIGYFVLVPKRVSDEPVTKITDQVAATPPTDAVPKKFSPAHPIDIAPKNHDQAKATVPIDAVSKTSFQRLQAVAYEMSTLPFVISFQVIAVVGDNSYEIACGNERAILKTYVTRFESKGLAQMPVTREGFQDVKTKDGFNAKWQVLHEALSHTGAFALTAQDVFQQTTQLQKTHSRLVSAVVVGLLLEDYEGTTVQDLASYLGEVFDDASVIIFREVQLAFGEAKRRGFDGLAAALNSGDLELVRAVLSKHSPDPKAVRRGTSLITLAIDSTRSLEHAEPILDILQEHGISINACGENGKTAVHDAVIKDDVPRLEFLTKRGANLGAADAAGTTALHLAASGKQSETVAKLLALKAPINFLDSKGRSTVFLAVSNQTKSISKVLLDHNADLKLQDNEGCSVLHYAAKANRTDAVVALLKKGVDVALRDKVGRTAASYSGKNSGISELIVTRETIPLGPDADWVLAHTDGTWHTGRSNPGRGAFVAKHSTTGKEIWRTSFAAGAVATPCIGKDGTIYFCHSQENGKGSLTVVDSSGKKLWSYPLEACTSPMAVDPHGGICFHANQRLYCLDSTGRLKWELTIDDELKSPHICPTIGPDGTIYVECRGRGSRSTLLAVQPSGQRKWQFDPLAASSFIMLACSPILCPDGSIYACFHYPNVNGTRLFCITPAGTSKWDIVIEGRDAPHLVHGDDGTIYACGDAVNAISPEGKIKWSHHLKANSPVILGLDGEVYAASIHGDVVRLTKNGTENGNLELSHGKISARCEHGVNRTIRLIHQGGDVTIIDYSIW